MVGHRVISVVAIASFVSAGAAQGDSLKCQATPVPEGTPASELYLEPAIWAAVPGPSLGLQIALGSQRDSMRIGGFIGTGRLYAPHASVDTETGYIGPELEFRWPFAGFYFGPRVAVALGGSNSLRFSVGARMRYHVVTLGFDVVHVHATEPTPSQVGYPRGTVVELGLGVTLSGPRQAKIFAGVAGATLVGLLLILKLGMGDIH